MAVLGKRQQAGPHQNVVVLSQLGFPDLLLHLPVCRVYIYMQLGFAQLQPHLLCILKAGFTDGHHHHLKHHS